MVRQLKKGRVTMGDIVKTEGIVLASMQSYVKATRLYIDDETKVKNILNEFKNGMVSLGDIIHGQRKIERVDKAIKKINTVYNFVRDSYDNNIFIDSGGYQIAVNRLEMKYIPNLIEAYSSFIESNDNEKTFYYIEDVVSTGDKVPTIEDAKELTILGLKRFNEIPKNKKKNIYFIYHFQNIELFDAWQDILEVTPPEEILDSHRWAVGGIVASSSSNNYDKKYISYMLPVVDILQRELSYLKTEGTLYFHVLGVTGLLDMIFFALFQELFKFYNFKLEMTFDSTGAVQCIAKGQFFYYLENDALYKIEMGHKDHNKRVQGFFEGEARYTNKEIMDIIKEKYINEKEFNTKCFNNEYYVVDENGKKTLHPYGLRFFIPHSGSQYSDIFDWAKKKAEQILPLYISGNSEFINELYLLSSKLKGNNKTSQSNDKITSIVNTLNLFNSILSGNKIFKKEEIRGLIIDMLNGDISEKPKPVIVDSW